MSKKDSNSKFQIWVTVLGFLGLLFIPNISWFFCHDNFGDDTSENRKLAEMPELKLGKISSFPKAFEAYWNDHVPFRSTIRNTWTKANVIGLHDSTSEKVIIGKSDGNYEDSWLFYAAKTDSNPVGDIQGIKTYDEQTLEKMAEKIRNETEKFKKNNIDLYYMVAPNKEDVYKEKLPDSIEFYTNKTRTEELSSYLSQKGIKNYYFAYEDLMEAKDLGQLYHKYDTHWNSLGAFIGFKGLVKMMGGEAELEKITTNDKSKATGDLLPMIGVQGYFEDEKIDVNWKSKKIDKKIMVIGDSYRTALKEYLEGTFAKATLVHRNDYKKGMIEKEKPDIVVYEFVERYDSLIKDCSVPFQAEAEKAAS